jgi:beta-glucosidase
VRRLIDWRRVNLAPGGSEKVQFTITRDMLMRLGPDLKPMLETGAIDVWIAPSAEDGLKGSFELS